MTKDSRIPPIWVTISQWHKDLLKKHVEKAKETGKYPFNPTMNRLASLMLQEAIEKLQ